MKTIALVLLGVFVPLSASASDNTCSLLHKFVESIKPGETRAIEFHTNWGSNFKDSTDPRPVFYAKRCVHHEYPQAKAACDSIMENGAVEFSEANAKEAVSCLSAGTTFAPILHLGTAEFDFSYGTEDRGSNITVTFGEDALLGGMVLSITAAGY